MIRKRRNLPLSSIDMILYFVQNQQIYLLVSLTFFFFKSLFNYLFILLFSSPFISTYSLQPYPRNWAPEGPTSMSLLARPSPSTMGGMEARRCLFTNRHVTRVGALHFLGGMMMRRPLCRQPRMAPPLASTMKLTRKLRWMRRYLHRLKTNITQPIK